MLKKIVNGGFLMKAGPIIFAGIVAVCQAIADQKEADRIDDMEERLRKLEEDEEEDDEEESE